MPVALAANALLDEAEFATFVGAGSALNTDDARRVINRASAIAEEFLQRSLITPAVDVVEFHTMQSRDSEIFLKDWPIVSVTTVHEDDTRVYGASGLLVVDTDYIVSKPNAKLIRVSPGAGVRAFMCGFRAVKVAYRYGYAIGNVPAHLKDFAGHIAHLLWSEKKRQDVGVTGGSDGQGNFTRITASHLPDWITEPVQGERAPMGDHTWERD